MSGAEREVRALRERLAPSGDAEDLALRLARLQGTTARTAPVAEEITGGTASLTLRSNGRTIAKLRGEPRRLAW